MIDIIPNEELFGWMSDADFEFLLPISTDKDCVEIGAWKGRTTFHLLQVCKSLVVIDPWEGLEIYPNDNFTNDGNVFGEFCKNFSRYYFHKGKQLEIYKKPAAQVTREMHQDRMFDMVFIDADHRYDCVVEDIGCWVNRVRAGGWLCGHDYHKSHWFTIDAVNDVIGELDHTPIYDTDDSLWAVQIRSEEHRREIFDRVLKLAPDFHDVKDWTWPRPGIPSGPR